MGYNKVTIVVKFLIIRDSRQYSLRAYVCPNYEEEDKWDKRWRDKKYKKCLIINKQ